MTYYTEHSSPLGTLLLAATEHGLCGLYFDRHRHFKGARNWLRNDRHHYLLQAARELDEYFAGERRAFDLPLDLSGTPFQHAVWRALQALAFGSTTSYRSIAQHAGNPDAIRAAGTAIGRNPVSIIVPCHRVLGAAGALCGYAGGLERKRYLLALEKEASRGTPSDAA